MTTASGSVARDTGPVGTRPSPCTVTVRVHRILTSDLRTVAPGMDEISVSCRSGDSVAEVLRRIGEPDTRIRTAVYDEDRQTVAPGLLIVLNDRVVSARACARTAVRDGDEVMFLPMWDGG